MKILGFLVMYNEVIKHNLERCLTSLKSVCDNIVILDDASTDNSVGIAKKYTLNILKLKKNIGFPNKKQKKMLLGYALTFDPDWILWLDADEILERTEKEELKALCKEGDEKGIDAFSLHEINLWRSNCWHRIDQSYDKGWFIRLWKNTGKLEFETETYLHPPCYPKGLNKIHKCSLKVIHYGFSSIDRIINKYIVYKAKGQSGWALDRLIDEKTLTLRQIDLKLFPESLVPKLEPKPVPMERKEWLKLIERSTCKS